MQWSPRTVPLDRQDPGLSALFRAAPRVSCVLMGAVSWEMTEPSGDTSWEHTAQLREASPVGTDGRDGGAGGEGAAARRPRGDRCSHTAQGRAPDTGQSHLPGPLPEGLIPA